MTPFEHRNPHHSFERCPPRRQRGSILRSTSSACSGTKGQWKRMQIEIKQAKFG
jgi:hypothetical protein